MDFNILSLTGIGAIIGLILLLGLFGKNKTTKNWGMGLVIFGIAGMLFAGTIGASFLNQPVTSLMGGATLAVAGTSSSGAGTTAGISYQPTVDYASTDKFASTSITGTSYYKVNSLPAKTSAVSNVNIGDNIQYWIDNATTPDYYWVQPAQVTMGAGVNHVVSTAFRNGTATVTLYDLVGRASITSGASNISMSANKQANIEITYQGTSKKSASPFGGVMVVATNSTISSVTCNGDALLSSNPFHVNYNIGSLGQTSYQWAYSPSLDDGTGSVKKITCQFQNGGSAVGAGASNNVDFIPANYYVSQTGNIVLDTEKNADGVNTRTGTTLNKPTATFNWGA